MKNVLSYITRNKTPVAAKKAQEASIKIGHEKEN
jgi:hypothetical protein